MSYHVYPDELIQRARDMRSQGIPAPHIAKTLGIKSVSSVYWWTRSEYREKGRDRQEAAKSPCQECGQPTSSDLCTSCNAKAVGKASRKWTRATIINAIQTWARHHGGIPPSSHHFARSRDPRWPQLKSIYGQPGPFKSWNEAIKAAGFTPLQRGERRNVYPDGKPYMEIETDATLDNVR